jgi:serpin B
MAKIPEFKVRDEKRLKNALKKMGAVDMFDYAADFKPLGHTSDDLYVTEVSQFTYLELDRNGTKAAAVTGITMANKAVALPEDPIPEVFLDRPFVYMIVDSVSGLPLFIGITDSL